MDGEFKGIWIPAEIWQNKELNLMEKLFITRINSLDNDAGCFASNKYFAEFFQITPQRASQIINGLANKRYITIEYTKEGKEIKGRVLNIFDTGIKYIFKTYQENLRGYQENVKGNNRYNNRDKKNNFISSVLSNSSYKPNIHGSIEDPAGFIEYWTESGNNDKLMRFEKEKSFDISRRLKTWESNQKKFQKPQYSNSETPKFIRAAL
jgi:hypothetical protein